MKIAITTASMQCGGTERVVSYVANHLASQGHEINLLLYSDVPVFYSLDPSIKVSQANITTAEDAGIISRFLQLHKKVSWFRKHLKGIRPEVIVSFQEVVNVMTLLAARGLRTPVIVSERTNPFKHKVPGIYETLRKTLYPSASAVVIQTEELLDWTKDWLDQKKVRVIANPVVALDSIDESELIPELEEGKWVLGCGRLCPEKGFDLLIKSFAIAAENRPDWRLLILGEGPEHTKLESLAKKLSVSNRVFIPGAVDNPGPAMSKCDLFMLTSKYEGFPNALCEAMAAGMASGSVIAGAEGIREIVANNQNGILIPKRDSQEVACVMGKLMDDNKLRKRLGEEAEKITARFDFKDIMNQWENLITEVAGK